MGSKSDDTKSKAAKTVSVAPSLPSIGKNSSGLSLTFCVIVAITLWTRFHKIDQPPWVCWDETHFGKMGGWYINRTFFFDVHPPLGKMFIGAVGYLTGYNATFPFEKPGDLYEDHKYLGMRIACTLLGACLAPFSYLTVWELTNSVLAATFAGALFAFDTGMLTLNQYILLDPILLFFISGSTYAMVKFRTFHSQPFSFAWWTWLTITGVMLGGAISVKFVGLFVILLVGFNTIEQLWDILGDMSKPFSYTVKHFMARAMCLIALPITLYIAIFYVHLSVLYKTGPGDGHFSSSFQSALENSHLYNASMPQQLAYGALVTLKSRRNGGGYLHSHMHLYPAGVGAKQQQVTSYAHKDENNRFWVKKWNEEPPKFFSEEYNTEEIELVRHGDLIRLEHIMTRRNIHSHSQKAPMSKKMYQVTGYGENGTGDANDVWRVEIVGGKEGDVVETVSSKVKLHHYFLKCVLTTTGTQLPKWGFEQHEVACNPTTRDPNALWNVEDNFYPRLPNVSFRNFAPGFVSRFIESHAVMLTGNAGLKPKEGEFTSRPWEWPIMFRGQFFSGGKQRIYLLGNPVIWWSNIGFLFLFVGIFAWSAVKEQRGYHEPEQVKQHKSRILSAGLWLFVGWALHYVPFWAMGRVLYYHHYFPALLFSDMITAILLDYIITSIKSALPEKLQDTFFHVACGTIIAGLWYSFYLFSPLAYGVTDETPASLSNSSVHHLKWLDSWEF